MKQNGEWGIEGDKFGSDPLRNKPLLITMRDQIRACKVRKKSENLLHIKYGLK